MVMLQTGLGASTAVTSWEPNVVVMSKLTHKFQDIWGLGKHVDMRGVVPVRADGGEKGLPRLLPELTTARCLYS